MVIGVAGKYCAGKNLITDYLEKLGFESIDVDKVGHKVLTDKKSEIVRAFGRKVTDSQGDIDRKQLGQIVFSHPKERDRLEEIVHPPMVEIVKSCIEQYRGKHVVINAAILFRMGLHKYCDLVICVRAPLIKRFMRALRRDALTFRQTAKRLLLQGRILVNLKGSDVDIYVVRNSGSEKRLKRKMDILCQAKGIP